MPDRERRQHDRVPVALEVAYRTTGNLLVAYTLNLSKGGLFVETDAPLPEGTPLALRLRLPGLADPIELSGRVAWVRWKPAGGQPAGMGVAFQDVEERVGRLIDRLVATFRGLKILYLGTDKGWQGVDRRVQSLFNCDVVRVASAAEAREQLAHGGVDLLALDMDAFALESVELLRAVRAGELDSVPILAVASLPADSEVAKAYGADVCIPPSISSPGLKAAVLECLAKPVTSALEEFGEEQ